MEARSIKELLIIVRDNKRYFVEGICLLTRSLRRLGIITEKEESRIDYYVNRNAPPPINQEGFRWNTGKWRPRLKWLNEQIEKLS